MRNLIFVSHANPEDNEFARWLTLHLVRQGYPVWLDLKHLLGGEVFWKDIEEAIRHKCVKFLYVLSTVGNTKAGLQKELAMAQTVAAKEKIKDFIIPIRIDGLPFAEINIGVHNLNTIPFEANWHRGFHQLLEKLEKDGTPKDPAYTPDSVTDWWRTQFGADTGVVKEAEQCISNWVSIEALPTTLYFHEGVPKPAETQVGVQYPTFEIGTRWASFATPEHFSRHFNIKHTTSFPVADMIDGIVDERYIHRYAVNQALCALLSDGWVRMTRTRDMLLYQLSQHRFCGALRQNQLPDDKVFYQTPNRTQSWRRVVGYKTMRRNTGETWVRFWHFGLYAQPTLFPKPIFRISTHVLFSDDGQILWDSPERQHKARRSQCKSWWNDDWRDRMLAVLSWLAKDGIIQLDFGGQIVNVAPLPITFQSPVRYQLAAKSNQVQEATDGSDMDDVAASDFVDDDTDEEVEP